MTAGDEFRLYRGMKGLENFLEHSNVLVHKNFCSASKDIEISKRFQSGKCCILTFLLPKNIKRYDYNDIAYEKKVLIQRNVQFTIDLKYRMVDGIKLFDAVVSTYEPPVIKMDIAARSSRQLDVLMIAESWKEELPPNPNPNSVEQLVESKKGLNLQADVYKAIKAMLLFYAKTS